MATSNLQLLARRAGSRQDALRIRRGRGTSGTSRLASLVAIVGSAVLVAGCGLAGSAASPSASPLPSPFADRVNVSGAATCGLTTIRTTETTPSLETQTATLHCTYEMSDARVSGSEDAQLTMHWVTSLDNEVDYYLVEGDVLTNDGGTWRGSGWGSEYTDVSGALYTGGFARYLGEDGYAGLSYRIMLARETGPGQPYIVAGWIEPAD